MRGLLWYVVENAWLQKRTNDDRDYPIGNSFGYISLSNNMKVKTLKLYVYAQST